jgi:hypothetical protein
LLVDQIESGARAAQRHVVEATLIVRDSTGPASPKRNPQHKPPTKARPH